jgi:hypothetical protein
VATTLLHAPQMALVAVVYGSFTFVTAVAFGLGMYRLNRWLRIRLKRLRA